MEIKGQRRDREGLTSTLLLDPPAILKWGNYV